MLIERLDRWFPYHSKLVLGEHYYLTAPYYRGLRADFFVRYDPFSRNVFVEVDTSAIFTDNAIILRTGEVIPAHNLSHDDFIDMKNQIAWLTVLFRTLGTPIPEIMLGNYDEVETYVIVNEDSVRQKIILHSFKETIKKLNTFYEGSITYFNFNEIVKSNGRIEFFGTLFVRDKVNDVVDFVDVRFHTSRQNQINLIMFFIYRDIAYGDY
jgi:hypothetical protein